MKHAKSLRRRTARTSTELTAAALTRASGGFRLPPKLDRGWDDDIIPRTGPGGPPGDFPFPKGPDGGPGGGQDPGPWLP